jgi:Sulfotransferase family
MYLYVMGRGHSGSTILDILVGASASVESLGELTSGLKHYETGGHCACGALVRECPFWDEVRRRFEVQGFNWIAFCRAGRRQTSVGRWLGTRLARADHPGRRQLATQTQAFARAVAETSGKPHLLDSNKETARGLFLLRYLPEARVIHLVRDPRGVLRSHYWRVAEGRDFRFMNRLHRPGAMGPVWLAVAALSWTVGNILCEAALRVAPRRVLKLRYEDLRADPASALRRIEAAFGLPLADVVAKIAADEAFPVGHNVGGNHIRHEGAVRFNPRAEKERPPLPRWTEALTFLLCWPLMRRYGYATRPDGSGKLPAPPGARAQEGS